MIDSTSSSDAGPAAGARAPAGRRKAVVAVVALVLCGAVGAAVVLTNPPADSQPVEPAIAAKGATGEKGTTTGQPAAKGVAPAPAPPPEAVQAEVKKVLAAAEELDRTVWAKEVEAQKYEEYFIRLWDDFRAASDKHAVLEGAALEQVSFGAPGETTRHDWGVTVTRYTDVAGQSAPSVDRAGWRAMLRRLRDAGYRPTELEFHQSRFEHEPPRPARSVVATVVHLVNELAGSRHVLRAQLKVDWAEEAGEDGVFAPRAIEVAEMSIAERTGDVAFQPVALPGGATAGLSVSGVYTGFVLVYDLDGDGLSEIVIPGENLLLRNRGGWRFERTQILPPAAGEGMGAGVIGDFSGDGLPDLLCTKGEHLFLVRGVAGGQFGTGLPGRAVTLDFAPKGPSALTAGDIDGDGDLDAWFAQYKPPYVGGQMPTPYYDANDGFPSALLVNDGTGHFDDRTEAAGLASKRHRRVQAGSLVDLDGDGDQDLLTNNDFSGLDIYYNDGRGLFTEVTDSIIDERHNFGMAHTFADFNLDGLLDMYTIGMSSTTARRLTAMGAGRQEFPEYQEKRPQMGFGNRMFLATAPSAGGAASAAPARFVQPPFKDVVARTGWSWGTASPDFDNDGDPDIFVANGYKSAATCRDHCTTYWRRDMYLASSKEDPVMNVVFEAHGLPFEVSWNGFEHDVLYMNEGGKGFINVAHLMGVAFESDSRNVIAEDFDADGKMDLLVLERRFPRDDKFIHVYRNVWPTECNWVGVRLAETRPGFSPIGAQVRVHTATGVQIGRIVTGDSIHSQHPSAKHFGLGTQEKVDAVEVVWPNGQVTRVERPEINKWHNVRPAATSAAAAAR